MHVTNWIKEWLLTESGIKMNNRISYRIFSPQFTTISSWRNEVIKIKVKNWNSDWNVVIIFVSQQFLGVWWKPQVMKKSSNQPWSSLFLQSCRHCTMLSSYWILSWGKLKWTLYFVMNKFGNLLKLQHFLEARSFTFTLVQNGRYKYFVGIHLI